MTHRAKRYFCKEKELFKISLDGEVMRCVALEDAVSLMGEVLRGVASKHQGGRSLTMELIKMGNYWPIME